MFHVLRHHNLQTGNLASKVQRVAEALTRGDFRAALASKLRGQPNLYRAALDDKARLIFKIARYQDQPCILLLELLRNHEYDKSRFLRGFGVTDESFQEMPTDSSKGTFYEDAENLRYVNTQSSVFHFLDRPISFDSEQERVLALPTPLLIVGSAGSGKTVLTLERMKQLEGNVLYVTHSPHLADAARKLYRAEHYDNNSQQVDFLSFNEVLETIEVPPGKEASFRLFKPFFERIKANFKLKDAHKVFEEIRGVITGSAVERPYLSKSDYLALGVKQSIILENERENVYGLFGRYLTWLEEAKLFDPNMLAFAYSGRPMPRYDYVVIDEVQDFTVAQINLLLKGLNDPTAFVMSGDANQVVHPNFFSWAKLKTFLHQAPDQEQRAIHILKANYRNAAAVTAVANRILLLKQRRFGSVDRESNFLVEANQDLQGSIQLLANQPEILRDIDQKTKRSTKACVIVLHDEGKNEAQKIFKTPLIFSIHEAKGLEYETVILFNVVSAAGKEFRAIAGDLTATDLTGELTYARSKDKADKSGEAYKFFINSLYVGVTRAVGQLVVLDQDPAHAIFELLSLGSSSSVTLEAKESSLDDWQKEARKLELQGRLDQAAQIRRDILQTTPVPWRVLNAETYPIIKQEALLAQPRNKKSQHQLFEFAATHRGTGLFAPLVAAKYSYAQDVAKNNHYVRQKLYGEASKSYSKEFWSDVRKYGIEHRSPMNETPLMAAVRGRGLENVKKLLELGANPAAVDNFGLTAYQKGLQDLICEPKRGSTTSSQEGSILHLVAPGSIRIKVNDKMHKLDANSSEFFLLNVLAGAFSFFMQLQGQKSGFPTIKSGDLETAFKDFNANILPSHRKTRSYLNSILSKNELSRPDRYNRQLFLRISMGHYIVNPILEVDSGDTWVNFYDYLGLDRFKGLLPPAYEDWLRKELPNFRRIALEALNPLPRTRTASQVEAKPTAQAPGPKSESEDSWGSFWKGHASKAVPK